MNARYQSISAEELAEYRAIILRNGFSDKDYQLREEIPKIKVLPSSTAPRSAVIIKNINTNKTKTYPSGVGSPWLVQFEDDLKHKRFR
jgi:hypothetical protein